MSRIPAICLLLIAALLGVPATASAATWGSTAETCGGGAMPNGDGAERGSGQLDAQGRLYLPCSRSVANGTVVYDNHIGVFDAAGRKTARIDLGFDRNGANYRASDVAPSPDGSFLYVVRSNDFTVYRFDRQADGRYVARSQAEWHLDLFPAFGGGAATYRPRGQFLATDAQGDIYLSAGLWTCQDGSAHCTDDAIVKYRPSGAFVTRFGRKVSGSWALGSSHGSFGGLAVTANGARVFVTDINNSRIQRFDRAADGSYGAVLAMGMNEHSDPNRWGGCYGAGMLAAPYDVALSPGGELLAINTTCYATADFYGHLAAGTIEIQRFGQDGSIRGSVTSQSRGDNRIHGIAVDRAGNVHLVQGLVQVAPAAGWSDAGADAGGGGPLGGSAVVDVVAPTLRSASAPATSAERAITIALDATDAVGVTQVRVDEDGSAGAWQPYAASIAHALTDRYGDHAFAVQVRDAAGNVSAQVAFTVRRPAPVVVPPPVVEPTPAPAPVVAAPTPVQPAPGQPAPTPVVVVGGGGAALADTVAPVIRTVRIPVQVFRGRATRALVVTEGAATQVRFSTSNGRWGAWQPVRGYRGVLLPAGAGWKGVFTQVRDAAGNRSTPWFHAVFAAPRGAGWYKGTAAADATRLGAGTQHADLSRFDRKVDRIACGSGFDTVLAQPEDIVAQDCERVTRVKLPVW